MSELKIRKWRTQGAEVVILLTDHPAGDDDTERLHEAVYAFSKTLATGYRRPEPPTPVGEGWRGIETYTGHAPVLVSRPFDGVFYTPKAAFVDVTGVWRIYGSSGGMCELSFDPTHWQPLPAPPVSLLDGEGEGKGQPAAGGAKA